MTILAIDTCLGACSVALLDRGATSGRVDLGTWEGFGPVAGSVLSLASRCEVMARGHAERIVPMIGDVMAAAGAQFADLEAVGVTEGPGTFTGIRIGVATARGIALACGIPIVSTTSLALLAATARAASGESDCSRPVVAAVDARKGEVYFQVFGASNGAALMPANVVSVEAAANELAAMSLGARIILAGSGAALLTGLAKPHAYDTALVYQDLQPDAVFMMAAHPINRGQGRVGARDALAPLYLRGADAVPPVSPAIARSP